MNDYSWLMVLCSAVVTILATVIANRGVDRADGAFLSVGESLGLSYKKGSFGSGRLEGVFENRSTTISSAGSSRNPTSGTIYQIAYTRPEFPRLMITRMGLVGGIGGEPILSGDAGFDAAYCVSCLDRTVGEALIGDATTREAVKEAQPQTVIIEGTTVYIKDSDTKPTPERMRQMLSLAAQVDVRAEGL